MHSSIDTPLVPLELIAQDKLLILKRFEELNDYLPDVGIFLKNNTLEEIKKSILFSVKNMKSIKQQLENPLLKQKTKSSIVAEQFIKLLSN